MQFPIKISTQFFLELEKHIQAGEMAQQLKELTALPEDPGSMGSMPSNHVAASCLSVMPLTLSHQYTFRQNTNEHNIKLMAHPGRSARLCEALKKVQGIQNIY